MTGLWWKSLLVAVIAFAFFAYGVDRAGVASTLANSVDRIHAQDESIYANAALRMAAQGNWLTPIVMGRFFLYKPPLLEDLAGLSLNIFGISLLALRLPSLLAASLAASLLFAWSMRARGLRAGLVAILLLLSNSVWMTFARLCYTDMLLASFTLAALFSLARDPRLESASARWSFTGFSSAAILTKSVAGFLPLLALCLFTRVGPRDLRPPLSRLLRIAAWTALCVAPWHLYQFLAHRQWFWTDYVQVQLLQFGFRPALPGSAEAPLWFYLKRLFLTDPFLCIAAAFALPAFVIDVRQGKQYARLLACWLGVVLAAISIFQYRNFPYAVMLIAPLCLLAAGSLPAKYESWIAAALVLALGAKLLAPSQVWSLAYSASQPLAASPWLRAYLDRGRANELILVDPDDEFYSAVLPLPKVRYCFRDPNNVTIRYAPYYVDLGITVTAAVFADPARWEPVFRERLRAWGLDSSEPIATAIIARDGADVIAIIRSHPRSDFYLPANLESPARAAAQATHWYAPASSGRFFLLSNHSPTGVPPRTSVLQ